MAIPERESYYISRNEAILENILGANNVIVPPESLIETLLQCLLYGTDYTETVADPAPNVAALLAIIKGESYDATPTCEIEAMLAAIANNEDPAAKWLPPKSRNGALLYEIYQEGIFGYDVHKWADVQKIAQKKLTSKYLAVGDELTLKYDGSNQSVVLVAINKDVPNATAQGDVLTFQFKNIFSSRSGFSSNIWRDAVIRTTCNTVIFNNFEDDVKSIIGEVKNITSAAVSDESIETVDKVFLLSRTQVYGGNELGTAEGQAYDFYKDNSTLPSPSGTADECRIKKRSGSADTWWLRSPGGTNTEKVRIISATGSISTLTVNVNSGGVCPAFCIY